MADEAQQPHTSNLPKMRTFGRDVQRVQRAQGITDPASTPDSKKKDAAPMHVPETVVDSLASSAPEKTSILSDAGRSFDVGRATQSPHSSGGTIVTDKRRKKRSFFGTIAAAFQERMGDAKSSISHMEVFQEKVAPRVTAPIARQDVIQKAAQSGVRAPEDDHRTVVETLKTKQQDAPSVPDKPFVIKEAPKEETPSWTHVVEEEKPEPEQKEQSTQKATSEPATDVTPEKPKPTPPVAPAPAPIEIPQPKPLPEVAPKVEEKIEEPEPQQVIEPVTQTQTSEPTLLQPEERVEAEPEPIPEPIPTPLPQTVDLPKVTEQPQKPVAPTPPREPGRFRALFMRAAIVLVILVAIGGGVGAGVYMIRTFIPQNPTPATTAPSIVQSDTQIPLPLSSTRNEFLSSLEDITMQVGPGITHIYPTTAEGVPATSSEILAVLSLRAPGSFTRSIGEYVTLGAVATPERRPFIVLITNSFDVGFAGMIAWEQYMSSDLAPFFGPTVTQTFDPSARTSGSTRAAYFVDAIIQNRSVRILYDQFGEESIVYGFADRNTIIITSSSQAFATVLARMQ